MLVVQVQRGRQRQAVLDLEFDLHRAGLAAGPQHRLHLAVGRAVQIRQLGLQGVEVGYTAGLQRSRRRQNETLREVASAGHAQALDAALGDMQPHQAVGHALLGQVDKDRQEAGVLVGLLQCAARRLDIGQRPLRPHEGQQCSLHRQCGQHAVALHLVLEHIEARCGRGSDGRNGRNSRLRRGGGGHRLSPGRLRRQEHEARDAQDGRIQHRTSVDAGHDAGMKAMVRTDHGRSAQGLGVKPRRGGVCGCAVLPTAKPRRRPAAGPRPARARCSRPGRPATAPPLPRLRPAA